MGKPCDKEQLNRFRRWSDSRSITGQHQ